MRKNEWVDLETIAGQDGRSYICNNMNDSYYLVGLLHIICKALVELKEDISNLKGN